MKFQMSSPDSLIISKDEFEGKKSQATRIAIGVLGLIAVAVQVINFAVVSKFMSQVI